jgi:hypothetical protein
MTEVWLAKERSGRQKYEVVGKSTKRRQKYEVAGCWMRAEKKVRRSCRWNEVVGNRTKREVIERIGWQ